jgi:hypothetical protein
MGFAASGNCLGSRSRMKRGLLIMNGGKLTVVVVVVVTTVVFVAGAVETRQRSWLGVTGRLGAEAMVAGDAEASTGVELEGRQVSRKGVCVERSRPFVHAAGRASGASGERWSMARGRARGALWEGGRDVEGETKIKRGRSRSRGERREGGEVGEGRGSEAGGWSERVVAKSRARSERVRAESSRVGVEDDHRQSRG